MSHLAWFIFGNISGAIVITAFWVIVGTYANKKDDKGDK
jgi:hypothetical protein